MKAKLIAVLDDPSSKLLAASDVPLSYLSLAVFFWQLPTPNKYDQKLSITFRLPVKFKVIAAKNYKRSYNPVERASAEERHLPVFNECVADVRRYFREIFIELAKEKRVYAADGRLEKFGAQIDRLC